MTRIVTTTYRYKRPPKKRKAVAGPTTTGRTHPIQPQPSLRRATQGGRAIMAEYKQAGDLVPDDLYIRRRRLYYRGPREQIYRVITTRPGNAATKGEEAALQLR